MVNSLSTGSSLATSLGCDAVKEVATLVSGSVAVLAESSESAETSQAIRCFGEPPRDFGIDIVTAIRPFSDTIPECAESEEDPWVWFYNEPAFLRLIEKWVRIHSDESLLAHANAIPGDEEAKARTMTPEGEPFPGHRNAANGWVCNRGSSASWWVASSDGSVCYVSLERAHQDANLLLGNRRNGFRVPLLSDNK